MSDSFIFGLAIFGLIFHVYTPYPSGFVAAPHSLEFAPRLACTRAAVGINEEMKEIPHLILPYHTA
jgi:hypothetical protein